MNEAYLQSRVGALTISLNVALMRADAAERTNVEAAKTERARIIEWMRAFGYNDVAHDLEQGLDGRAGPRPGLVTLPEKPPVLPPPEIAVSCTGDADPPHP